MADKKVSELAEATSAAQADVFLLVQGGVSKKISKLNLFSTLDVAGKCLSRKTHETLIASGVVSTTIHTTFINVGAGTYDMSLAAGEEGMIKTVACSGNTGTITLSVLDGLGFTVVDVTGVGSTITMHFVDGAWTIIGSHNVVIS